MSTGTLPDFNPQDPLGLDSSLSDDEIAVVTRSVSSAPSTSSRTSRSGSRSAISRSATLAKHFGRSDCSACT